MADPWDFDWEAPPAALSPPQQALWWLKKGGLRPGPAWERAHEIAQRGEGDRAHDLVHGLVHWIEGDQGNADYWYRRAGSARRGDDPAGEWAALAAFLGG